MEVEDDLTRDSKWVMIVSMAFAGSGDGLIHIGLSTLGLPNYSAYLNRLYDYSLF